MAYDRDGMDRPDDAPFDWEDLRSLHGNSIPFALDEDGKSRDVDEVKRGLACACACPACRGRVIARQGDVRVHHFAHEDRRECRHALEASIFGMVVKLLAEPDARLRLPPFGDRAALAREVGATFTPEQQERFFASKWVVDEEVLPMEGAVFFASFIDKSSVDSPDLTVPNRHIGIHLISYKKRPKDLCESARDGPGSVLGIDLRSYAALWWQACDNDNDGTRRAATQATAFMRHWLVDLDVGRGWLANSEFNRRRDRLVQWLGKQKEKEEQRRRAEELRQLAERERIRHREASDPWRIPAEYPSAVDQEDIRWHRTAQGLEQLPPEFMKPVRALPESISEHEAAVLGLLWHNGRRSWFFAGLGWSLVPIPARSMLDVQSPWEFVTRNDRDQLRRPQNQPSTLKPESAGSGSAVAARTNEAEQTPDEVIRSNVGTCVLCGAAINEVILRSGPFEGRRALCCSNEKRHPMRMA